jgi:galactitol-specific phosphotransferase system IIB component
MEAVMTKDEIKSYCESQGVPFNTVRIKGVDYFRVLDLTQLPDKLRGLFDERGILPEVEVEEVAEAQAEEAKAEVEAPPPAPKKKGTKK